MIQQICNWKYLNKGSSINHKLTGKKEIRTACDMVASDRGGFMGFSGPDPLMPYVVKHWLII